MDGQGTHPFSLALLAHGADQACASRIRNTCVEARCIQARRATPNPSDKGVRVSHLGRQSPGSPNQW